MSRNQKTSVIVKFVYFETKNRVYGRKKFLKNVLSPVNKEPVYITERLTKRDSDLFDYSRGLGMYTMTYNCITQVFIANDNGGFRRHNLIDEKDADEIFERKNPLLLKSNSRGINSTVRPQFNMTKSGRSTLLGKTRDDFLKRGRQISPDLDNKQLMTELAQYTSDPVGLFHCVQTLQRDSLDAKQVYQRNKNDLMETMHSSVALPSVDTISN